MEMLFLLSSTNVLRLVAGLATYSMSNMSANRALLRLVRTVNHVCWPIDNRCGPQEKYRSELPPERTRVLLASLLSNKEPLDH